jgi:hypothetical protein
MFIYLFCHNRYIYIYTHTHLRTKQDRKQVNEYFVAGCPQQLVKPITVVPITDVIRYLNKSSRAKINAKFGQNLKMTEKFWYVLENIFVSLRKLRDVTENVLRCTENFFWYVRKNIWGGGHVNFYLNTEWPPPPAPQQFWGEILMFSLPVRANYTVPLQTRLGPYAHAHLKCTLPINPFALLLPLYNTSCKLAICASLFFFTKRRLGTRQRYACHVTTGVTQKFDLDKH